MSGERQVDTDRKNRVATRHETEAPTADAALPIEAMAALAYRQGRLDPRALSPAAISALQRTVGNAAVNGLLRQALPAALSGLALQRASSALFIQRQWTVDEKDMPKSAAEWITTLTQLNIKNSTNHTFVQEGDLIHINPKNNVGIYTGLTIHFEKLAELTRAKLLENLVVASAQSPEATHELVKTGGYRLRFDNNLMQSVDKFITDFVPSMHQAKVRDFLTGSLTPHQDRMRLFDIVNDTYKDDAKKKAAAYAAEEATDARLFANHYTFFMSHNPDGKLPPHEVKANFEQKRKAADKLKFGPCPLKPAQTAQEAENIVRAAHAEITFESFEAAASHLEKHPLQNQQTDRLDRYLAWARIAIAKGDVGAGAKRAQFDAGWDVPFNYFGHTLIVKLRPDGQAFIATFMTQGASYQPSEATGYYENAPTAGPVSLVDQPAMSQPIERARVFIRNNLMEPGNDKGFKKQEQRPPNVPDPNFIPGATFTCPLKGKPQTTLTVMLLAQRGDDTLMVHDQSSFTIVLNATVKSGLNERTLYYLGEIGKFLQGKVTTPQEKVEQARQLLETASNLPATDPGKQGALTTFASFATGQLGIDPRNPVTFEPYAQCVVAQLLGISKQIDGCMATLYKALPPTDPAIIKLKQDIEVANTDLKALKQAVSTASDKKTAGQALKKQGEDVQKLEQQLADWTGAPARAALSKLQQDAQSILNLFAVLQARLIKQQYETQSRKLPPKARITGDLIYHLITPERANPGTFKANGISGGHLESNLRLFLAVFPDYHFVLIKEVKALGTTLRLYKQYMWIGQGPPPSITDATNRPTAKVNPLPQAWLESGVMKSTAEDLIGWLSQGMDALDAWAEFDPQGPASQRIGRGLYENAPGERAIGGMGVEFGGRVETERLHQFVVTQLVPHIDWLLALK